MVNPPCISKDRGCTGGVNELDWMNAPTKVKVEAGRNIGGIKVRHWISNPISFWALLEQIRSAKGFKDANETTFYCIMECAKDLGIES